MEDGSSISFTTGHAPGAYVLAVDPTTGRLVVVDTVTDQIGENPSYVVHNPATRAVYYTSEPGGIGVVKAYTVEKDWNRAAGKHAKLKYLNELETAGAAPCFLEVGPDNTVRRPLSRRTICNHR